jgi:hypothetical protein
LRDFIADIARIIHKTIAWTMDIININMWYIDHQSRKPSYDWYYTINVTVTVDSLIKCPELNLGLAFECTANNKSNYTFNHKESKDRIANLLRVAVHQLYIVLTLASAQTSIRYGHHERVTVANCHTGCAV